MSRYTFGPGARQDLVAIFRYIAKENRPAAGHVLDEIERKLRLLARQPLLGEARDDLAAGIRAFTAGRYLILYRAKKHGISVVQVVHSAQDLDFVFRRPKKR